MTCLFWVTSDLSPILQRRKDWRTRCVLYLPYLEPGTHPLLLGMATLGSVYVGPDGFYRVGCYENSRTDPILLSGFLSYFVVSSSCETWESFPSYPVLNGSFASVFYSFENCWAACGVPSSVYTEDPDVEVKSNLWGSPGPYWQLWAGEMATQGLRTGQSLTGFQNVSNGT